jgi:Protein of unknown function (DUF732)
MWGRFALAATAATAIIGGVGTAHADPGGDYLNQLGNTPGFTVNGFTSILLTNAGNGACNDLRAGITPEDAAVRQLSFPGSSLASTRIMVSAAQQNLCPDTLH